MTRKEARKEKEQANLSYNDRRKLSTGDKVFQFINATILVGFAAICIIPFLNVIGTSFASVGEIFMRNFIIVPYEPTLLAYRYVLSTPTIPRALLMSVIITVGGTLVSITMTAFMAYGLSKKTLPGRRWMNFLVLFTMLFSGGMIPSFLLVNNLGLIDSLWSQILPVAVGAYNLIIMRNFFSGIPESLEEAAKLDGCSDFGVFFRIVLPLSLPSIATISLFYAVNYWNTFQSAILYLNDSKMWPMQVLLRQIVIVASGIQADTAALDIQPPSQSIKMAVIVIAIVPMLIAYPFVQKYFVKGAMVGSVKG